MKAFASVILLLASAALAQQPHDNWCASCQARKAKPASSSPCSSSELNLCPRAPERSYAAKLDGYRAKHARYYWLVLAESHLTRRLFALMVRRIELLSLPAG